MPSKPANIEQFEDQVTVGRFYQCTSIVTECGILTETIEFESFAWPGEEDDG